MDRVYFDINEKLAKQAHDMMSFRDYSPGRLTAEYRGYVDKAYDLADEAAKERPESAEKAYKLAERYSKRMADNLNASSRIGCMCPSVMVCGAGNFPVRKKEKQNAAADKNYKEFQEIQKLLDKIRGIINGKDIILSGEADAIQRLESKLGMMKAEQEKMKAANKAIRLNDEAKGNQKLKEMGYTDEQIIELRKPDFCGRIGFADYVLKNNNANIHRVEHRLQTLKASKEQGDTEYDNKRKPDFCGRIGFADYVLKNNNANIHRVEHRLQTLKASKEQGDTEYDNKHFKVVENTEIMRLQLMFNEKPDADTRLILKRNGFRWSPKNGSWQRQLTPNARYALKSVIEALEER